MKGKNYSDKKRYFINNYLKSKFSSSKIFGGPKCIFCGNDKILDLHHVYTYMKNPNQNPYSNRNLMVESVDKIIFICPNHHYFYHRLIDTQWAYHSFFIKNYPKLMFDLKLINKRIKEFEHKKIPFYKKPIIEKGAIGKIIGKDKILKRYGDVEGKKLLNKNGMVAVFKAGEGGRYSYMEVANWFDKKTMNEIPKCIVCGYKIVLDAHHIYKEGRIYFFCPTHHYMVHRHLQDKKGDKTTLKEIIENIKKIEENKLPYFKEVNETAYKTYKGYNLMKIKE